MRGVCVVVCVLVVHSILILSVFDIYFITSLLTGIKPVPNILSPPAQRVVVILIDGLRFDAFVSKNAYRGKPAAPFMRSIVQERGTWGISSVSPPTETLPGVLSIIGGFREDPANFRAPWRDSVFEFDSIFNYANCSFVWGEHRDVEMFTKFAKSPCLNKITYYHQEVKNRSDQDLYQFQFFKEYFGETKPSETILKSHKLLLFIHFKGQADIGYQHREEYLKHLLSVDQIVRELEGIVQNYYNDNRTAFIVTSAHGMPDKGTFGGDTLGETQTPILVWGAGVSGPCYDIELLDSVQGLPLRRDIDQIDIAALIAALLGVSVPVHSQGVLPLYYLEASTLRYKSFLLNAEQIAAQALQTSYKPHVFAHTHSYFNYLHVAGATSAIYDKISNAEYAKAYSYTKQLIKVAFAEMQHIQLWHHQFPLLLMTSCSSVFWLLTLIVFYQTDSVCSSLLTLSKWAVGWLTSIIISAIWLLTKSAPFTFYFHFLMPQVLLWFSLHKSNLPFLRLNLSLIPPIILFCVVSVVLSLALVTRSYISVLLFLPIVWPIFIKTRDKPQHFLWIILSILLGIFTFLPVIGKEKNSMQLITSGSLLLLTCIPLLKTVSYPCERFTLYIRSLLVVLALVVVGFPAVDVSFIVSCILCCCSFLISINSFYRETQILYRILFPLVYLYYFLSVSYELTFLLILLFNIIMWIQFEKSLLLPIGVVLQIPFKFRELRIALFLSMYIMISFFGLYDIKRIIQFDNIILQHFTTSQSFTITVLFTLIKVLLPVLAILIVFCVMTAQFHFNMKRVFLLALMLLNLMSLPMIFIVKNSGTRLEVNNSILRYCAPHLGFYFVVMSYYLIKLLTS